MNPALKSRGNVTAGLLPLLLVLIFITGCSLDPLEVSEGSFEITVHPGDTWLHEYPILGPISKLNAPTFAIWITDESGNFIDTVFVTRKMGQAGWIANDDPRPEALPIWSRARGGQPTADQPAPDGITGASPCQTSSCVVTPTGSLDRFYIWMEINHSIDYNSAWPEGISNPLDPRYSGGTGGSGQPALVYRSLVDLPADQGRTLYLSLIGHSEPGGVSDGTVYPDISHISTAGDIVKKIEVYIR